MTTPKTPTELRRTSETAESHDEIQDRIRRRAFELYEGRGREDGHEIGDWLQAKSECSKRL